MRLLDARWEGRHGIGRFAKEIRLRLPDFELASLGGKPSDPVDPIRLTGYLRKIRPSLFLSPGYNAPVGCPCPFVLTLHDLNHLVVRENSSVLKRAYYRYVTRPAVRRSIAVLTVSEFSRQSICEWAEVSDSKVINVGNGISTAFRRAGVKHNAERPYFLYVGNHRPHKNFSRLLKAFALSRLSEEIMLLSTGEMDATLRAEIEELQLGRAVGFVGPKTDVELAELYRGAVALILVSLYEGFGLPIVEAMACGTPVLTSDCASMAEVAGDAALLVDPHDIESIAWGMKTISTDGTLREALVCRGNEVAKGFSWDSTAQKIIAALGL